MRITSILRTGTLASALTAAIFAAGPVVAAHASDAPSQQRQLGSTGAYDGVDFHAAARSET